MFSGTTLLLLLGILFVLIVVLIGTRRGSASRPQSSRASPLERLEPLLPDVQQEEGEELASPIAEQIERMVQKKLAEHPDLAGQVVDFGTGADGSLEIWISGNRYVNVEDIPDERVRDAISKAVNTFNS